MHLQLLCQLDDGEVFALIKLPVRAHALDVVEQCVGSTAGILRRG